MVGPGNLNIGDIMFGPRTKPDDVDILLEDDDVYGPLRDLDSGDTEPDEDEDDD